MEPSILAFEPGLGTVRDSCRIFFNTLLAAQWRDLSRKDAVSGHCAVLCLAAGGDRSVDMLKERLGPIGKEQLQSLIAQLDAENVTARNEAANALMKLGAETSLRAELETSKSFELRARIKALLKDIESPVAKSPEALQRNRAIQVLERINSTRARELLKTLGTRDTLAALKRLEARDKR